MIKTDISGNTIQPPRTYKEYTVLLRFVSCESMDRCTYMTKYGIVKGRIRFFFCNFVRKSHNQQVLTYIHNL